MKPVAHARAFACAAVALIAAPSEARFLQVDPVGYEDYINLYLYTGNDPVNRIDPTGRRDIFIGGKGDTISKIVMDYASNQRRLHPNRDIQYFIWSNTDAIRTAVFTTPAGEPLNVIGHSLGGAEAMRQHGLNYRSIDTLVTIDPVDMPGNAIDAPTANNIDAKNWINVTANPSSIDKSDVIAAVGGKVSSDRTSGANTQVNSSAHHGEFKDMMQQSGAQRAIDRTYCDRSKSKPC